MAHFRLFVYFCIAVVAVAIAAAVNEEESREEEDLTLLGDESFNVSERYVQCESLWSCEDCNVRKFCLQFIWYTGVWYFQCPKWSPYCNASTSACVKDAPDNCGDPW